MSLQDPEAALQQLCRTLLALSMAYELVFFVLQLEDHLQQAIVRSSSNLHGLARAAGVKLQLLTSFSAASTQVGNGGCCGGESWHLSGTSFIPL